MTDRDPIDVGEPDESELADEALPGGAPERIDVPDDERAEDELEPLGGGAETIAVEDDEERPHGASPDGA
jgi:hypothetical protein